MARYGRNFNNFGRGLKVNYKWNETNCFNNDCGFENNWNDCGFDTNCFDNDCGFETNWNNCGFDTNCFDNEWNNCGFNNEWSNCGFETNCFNNASYARRNNWKY